MTDSTQGLHEPGENDLPFEVAGLSDVGRRREINEDTLGDRAAEYADRFHDRGYLYAVADGMGGYEKGEVASSLAIDALFKTYYESPAHESAEHAFVRAIQTANLTVFNKSQEMGGHQMGTTLTCVLFFNHEILVGNIGDSRTYILRSGTLTQLSEDHSWVAEQIRDGLLTKEQARHSSHRNVITRAVGFQPAVEADLRREQSQPGDVVILCSDGLHGQVEDDELAAMLRSYPLDEAVKRLIALANERGGPDNITLLTIRVTGDFSPGASTLVTGPTTLQTASYRANAPTQPIPVVQVPATMPAATEAANPNDSTSSPPVASALTPAPAAEPAAPTLSAPPEPMAAGSAAAAPAAVAAAPSISAAPSAPALPPSGSDSAARSSGGRPGLILVGVVLIIVFAIAVFLFMFQGLFTGSRAGARLR
ncbi:MAG: Stp1/IreP family PP2C-type Ser/Thr phosphatase, partial [Chloroflexi bacterium]|nr:Stp1/IreP family PP2C-type Ser/Thr phosphatase [Chloroflexota bacterium]